VIRRLAHVIHVTDDIDALNRWYATRFAPHWFMGWPEPHYLESERRLASMFMLDDVCIETMAPAPPVDETTAVGRYLLRHGPGLYAIAFLVDDLPGWAARLNCTAGEHYFVTRAKDMGGVQVEFLNMVLSGDPRPEDAITGGTRIVIHVDEPEAAEQAFARIDASQSGTTFEFTTGESGLRRSDGTWIGFAAAADTKGTV